MQAHVKNYFENFGYTTADIIPRSRFGTKTIEQRDHITNLIAVCRNCHEKAHEGKMKEEIELALKSRKIAQNERICRFRPKKS